MNFKEKISNLSENSKILLSNTIGAFIIKGGALVVSLFTMPAFIRYFEDQQILGVWFTVLSVLTWILSFDLGIGNGLRNKLIKAISENNRKDIKRYITSAYLMIGVYVGIFMIIGYIVFPYIEWNKVFNISKQVISPDILLNVMRCVFIGIMLQFFLRLVSSILYALQKSAINNLITLITSVLQLVFVISIPSYSPEKNLIILAYGFIIFSTLPLIITNIIVFKTTLKDCIPNINYFKKEYARAVLRLGGAFFWCQIMYMIIVNTNEFFISTYFAPEYVVEYQVYNKLFSLIGMLFTLALTPVWSAVTKSITEMNYNWLKKIYSNLKKIALIAIVCEFGMIIFLELIINIWLGQNAIRVNYAYATCFALFGSAFTYQSVLSTIACGTGRMKLQMVFYTIGVIFKFGIVHFGAGIFNSWIVVILANAIILIPYCIAQQISLNRFIKNNTEERGKLDV